MHKMRKALLFFTTYLFVLFLSIGIFYASNGSFSVDFFGFPTAWALWFYFLYAGLPLGILIRLVFQLSIRKKTLAQSFVSIAFLISLSMSHILYGVMANTYKSSLYEDVKATQNYLENTINNISAANVSSKFNYNKYNNNLSYKVTLLFENTLKHEVIANVHGFIKDKHVFSTSLILLPNNGNLQRSFIISENRLRGKANSNDEVKLNISYAIDFPQKQYLPLTNLAQQLCTWSIIECDRFDQETIRHNTQLFTSSIFTLPAKITSTNVFLTKLKLREFSNLDLSLPFDNFSSSPEKTTIKDGVINKFVLNLNVHSKINGNVYINIPFVSHSGILESTNITYQNIIKQGDNAIAIPIGINKLSNVVKNSKQNAPLKFTLFISNNRFWYCPDRICDIVNKPHQNKKFVIKSESKYSKSSFKHSYY